MVHRSVFMYYVQALLAAIVSQVVQLVEASHRGLPQPTLPSRLLNTRVSASDVKKTKFLRPRPK